MLRRVCLSSASAQIFEYDPTTGMLFTRYDQSLLCFNKGNGAGTGSASAPVVLSNCASSAVFLLWTSQGQLQFSDGSCIAAVSTALLSAQSCGGGATALSNQVSRSFATAALLALRRLWCSTLTYSSLIHLRADCDQVVRYQHSARSSGTSDGVATCCSSRRRRPRRACCGSGRHLISGLGAVVRGVATLSLSRFKRGEAGHRVQTGCCVPFRCAAWRVQLGPCSRSRGCRPGTTTGLCFHVVARCASGATASCLVVPLKCLSSSKFFRNVHVSLCAMLTRCPPLRVSKLRRGEQ